MAPSPFFHPGATAKEGSIALLHLRRDSIIPVVLSQSPSDNPQNYAEGPTVTTRFGSYPHKTLIDLPWGSQVVASKVDTGTRGRKNQGKKRKREAGGDGDNGAPDAESFNAPVEASSGYAFILPPTPEAWTLSLPHRTQVVYTPDYSYVLQRLRVRPGSVIIEAGAGSGSFTHAAARAVFNGYPSAEVQDPSSKRKKRFGKVYSFEYHEPRVQSLRHEIKEHGLEEIVHVTHRDVYNEGFVPNPLAEGSEPPTVQADAIFLDLPAPWHALKHLTRAPLKEGTATSDPTTPADSKQADPPATAQPPNKPFTSPLNPLTTTHICTFLPCIEQAQRCVTTLRKLDWTDIEMVEVMHKRLDIRRERVGLQEEGLKNANASAKDVGEAVERLREVEGRWKSWAEGRKALSKGGEAPEGDRVGEEGKGAPRQSKRDRLQSIKDGVADRKLFKEGRLVHRTEPDLKTHTSYLVFATLPRLWTAEDEQRARKKWATSKQS